MSRTSGLTQATQHKELTNDECAAIFTRLSRNLARFRNTAELHATTEASLTGDRIPEGPKGEFITALNDWTTNVVKNLWLACREPGGGAY